MAVRASTASRSVLPRLLATGESRRERDGPWHSHGAPEIVLVVRGQYSIAIGEQVLPGRPGTLFVLPPGVPHAVRSPGAWASRYVVFEQPLRMLDETPRALDVRREPRVARWMKDLHELNQKERRLDDAVADGLLFAILSQIARLEEQHRAVAALHPALERATRFIQEHLTGHIDSETLARNVYLSHGHLCRLFQAQFGCAPRTYQLRLRLEHSRRLLRDPYLTVKEVAARSGFDDVNYYVRLFRREYGKPPGAWRRTSGPERFRPGGG
jgi:AraC-like DNA-binding protein